MVPDLNGMSILAQGRKYGLVAGGSPDRGTTPLTHRFRGGFRIKVHIDFLARHGFSSDLIPDFRLTTS